MLFHFKRVGFVDTVDKKSFPGGVAAFAIAHILLPFSHGVTAAFRHSFVTLSDIFLRATLGCDKSHFHILSSSWNCLA